MDKLALAPVVQREVAAYVLYSPDAISYYTSNETTQVHAVLEVSRTDPGDAGVIMMAQIIGPDVVIWCDTMDRPLYEALVAAGISREHIILAYQGEVVPKPAAEIHRNTLEHSLIR